MSLERPPLQNRKGPLNPLHPPDRHKSYSILLAKSFRLLSKSQTQSSQPDCNWCPRPSLTCNIPSPRAMMMYHFRNHSCQNMVSMCLCKPLLEAQEPLSHPLD